MTDAATLRARIEEAFGATPYPGDERIVYDNTGYHLECAAVKKILKGRHWRELTFDELLDQRSALSFLTPEGFRFYIPAFMRFVIDDFSRSDTISGSVIDTLTPPRLEDVDELRGRMKEFFQDFPDMKTFTPEMSRQIEEQREKGIRSGEALTRFAERVSGFTAGQSAAIRHYLEYMRDTWGHEFDFGEPQKALDLYWGKLGQGD